MGKRAYYRDYRPRKLSQVMGQPHITKTLQNAIDDSRFSHAYLFSGPRGVGKTSVARILAHEVNKLEYDDDSTHLDIIEIDAASNRRIDEIRDLRDKIGIAPTSAPYKVYIIDEVHMLTKESFNALLKTLEEPPQHAIFILATTEAHRLPDTILSRTQRYSFNPISVGDLTNHLESIAKKEKISIPNEALTLVSEHASGSFRDGLSALDQLATSHGRKISVGDVRESLGLAPETLIENLLQTVTDGDTKSLLQSLDEAYGSGTSAPMLSKQIIGLLQKEWAEGRLYSVELLTMSDKLLQVQSSSEPEIKLTIVLLEACLHNSQMEIKPTPKPRVVNMPVVETVTAKESPAQPKVTAETESDDEIVQTSEFDQEAWLRVLNKIKASNNSLYAVLRMANAGLNGSDDVVILTFQFPFHQKQVSNQRNKQLVERALSDEMGKVISLKLIVNKEMEEKNTEEIEKLVEVNDDQLSSIMDIMGGGEVVNI